MNQNELLHYGVKGMKWGVRKEYVYESKPRVSRGNTSNSNINKKVNTVEEVNNDKKTILTKKNIVIGAAAVGAAMAVMGLIYINKKGKIPNKVMEINTNVIDMAKLSKKDTIISRHKTMQRISSKKFEDYVDAGKSIYVAFEQKDKRLYKEVMPNQIKQWAKSGIISGNGSKAYSHSIKLNKDIKVASPYKTMEIYKKIAGLDEVKDYQYKNFMTGLVDRDNPINKQFIGELLKSGYNAIFDENDMGWAKKPLILLNPKDDILKVKSHQIGKIESILNVILR